MEAVNDSPKQPGPPTAGTPAERQLHAAALELRALRAHNADLREQQALIIGFLAGAGLALALRLTLQLLLEAVE